MLNASQTLQHDLPDAQPNRRIEGRTPITGDVFFTHPSANPDQPYQEALTSDISETGACIYCHCELPEGYEITLYGKVFGEFPKNAIVRWCNHDTDDIYRIGLSLIPVILQ